MNGETQTTKEKDMTAREVAHAALVTAATEVEDDLAAMADIDDVAKFLDESVPAWAGKLRDALDAVKAAAAE